MRGLHIRAYSQEAFIHWNGPAIHKANSFLVEALCERYGGGVGKWNFVTDGISKFLVSQVVDKHLSCKSKLPPIEG